MTHDPKIVAHLRNALDEVAAKPAVRAMHTAPARRPLDARRWVAIAASLVIVAGAIVGIAMYRGDSTKVATDPTTTTSTVPAIGDLTMPYFLAAADLAPGEVTSTPSTGGGPVVIAWARNGDMADGLLVVQAVDSGATVATAAASAERVIDGTTLRFNSHGLSASEREALVAQVIPGSGLPWILPVDGWTMVAMATPADGPTQWQSFGDAATIASGPMNITLLAELASADTITKVAIAGQPGWRLLTPNRVTVVFWRDPVGGQWVSLTIHADMADRVEGLILAVVPAPVEVSMGTATSSYALAPFDGSTPDPAVGQKVPPIQLTTGELTVDSPTLFVFVAHWCPHCAKEIPLLQQAIDDGTLAGVRVVMVSTAASTSGANYPPASWLASLGWTGETVNDTTSSDGAPGMMAGYFGTPGFPYVVMVGSDGLVTARASGEMPIDDVVALAHTGE
ncbi:MAG: redoxin domain-containing protein [Actinobacteria bacterium]|uniref:Unannotated protein n=1 Tax=freshwater metagenome TaxID=449393 RepID=A0A6J7BKD9_9ZZZZ|nr:redoxin domain-containing protein [Actinomycetota bacterium]MSW76862.1 redoxin domain-containing protein [Actinomycetota bacterium]MSX53983.1 redoxin domain-containing protein [Actinomycetota bacterium]MSX93270.1 redoxin domain-containing protein [Actinomycetota bacterium]MSZ83452.1 redoxin domain-containing protein [Actinomycetota bacterium]